MQCTCGYDGHRDHRAVQFISRYKDENDYCVNGVRVRLTDDGVCDGTPEQREALTIHLLDEYVAHIKWRTEQFRRKYGEPGPLPAFTCPRP